MAEQRLFELQQEGTKAQQQALKEDLGRQLARSGFEQKWEASDVSRQRRELGRQAKIVERDRPEQLGRLGSQFAARGAFHSGARQEAQSDLFQQLGEQIRGLRLGSKVAEEEGKRAALQRQWGRQDVSTKTKRALADIERQLEANALQYQMQRASGRGGGGGFGSFAVDPMTLTPPSEKLYGKPAIYKGQQIGAARGADLSLERQRQLIKSRTREYADLYRDALTFLQDTRGQGTDTQFLSALEKVGPGQGEFAAGNPQLVSVAMYNARRSFTIKNQQYQQALSIARQYFQKTNGQGSENKLRQILNSITADSRIKEMAIHEARRSS